MEWISVFDDLPKEWEIVWIYWRNREILLGCKTEPEQSEPDECWYSLEDDKCRYTLCWQYYRGDKPNPPDKNWLDKQKERIPKYPPIPFGHLMNEWGQRIIISEQQVPPICQ